MEFIASPGSIVFNRNPNIVLPFEPFDHHQISGGAAWHDKKTVQDALNCCLATYEDLSGIHLTNFLNEGDSFFTQIPEAITFGVQKSVLAISEDVISGQTVKTMFIAFRGTATETKDDVFTDIDIKMSGIEENENESKLEATHNGLTNF